MNPTTEPTTDRRAALVVVDAQHDFTEGWALPVEGGTAVCQRIADLLDAEGGSFATVFATYCWHPTEAPFHFVAEGQEPDFEAMWPRHCVAGTDGAENPPVLDAALDAVGATRVYKGQTSPGYSGFEAHANQDGSGPGLSELLDDAGITDVVVVGLALDFCVRATAADAARWADAGSGERTVTVRRDLTAAVDPSCADDVVDELRRAGVGFTGQAPHLS